MSSPETAALIEELEHYRAEKEQIRHVLGSIGGAQLRKREHVLTVVFCVALVILFAGDVLHHFTGIAVPWPPLFSLEIGVLLVSLKIIWMIRKQAKAEHFQFWILTSIEFRINSIGKRLNELEQNIDSRLPKEHD